FLKVGAYLGVSEGGGAVLRGNQLFSAPCGGLHGNLCRRAAATGAAEETLQREHAPAGGYGSVLHYAAYRGDVYAHTIGRPPRGEGPEVLRGVKEKIPLQGDQGMGGPAQGLPPYIDAVDKGLGGVEALAQIVLFFCVQLRLIQQM